MNPPLRSTRDVEAIREGLADGTIDAIATDHAPHGVGDKSVEFELAPNGVVGLETAVPLALELVTQGILDARRAVALLTAGPAAAFGLPGGQLGVGAPADVTIVDPSAEWTIDGSLFFSKARNTPFEGRKVRGRVVATLVGGRIVFQHGEVKEQG
jgi:dihydroorotase